MSAIAIVGESGTGKSTSIGNIPELGIKGLNPKETIIINVAGKDLPFRGWRKQYTGKISEGGNYFENSDNLAVASAIKFISESRTDIKNIVIEDGQYLMGFEFMKRASEKGYEKFSQMGVNMAKVLEAARNSRSDLKVFFLWHPDKDRDGNYSMKTVGKMISDYLTLEGLFTYVLYTKVSSSPDGKILHQFVTNNDGNVPAKTPVGMFKDLYIPNDLALVSESIDAYNNGE